MSAPNIPALPDMQMQSLLGLEVRTYFLRHALFEWFDFESSSRPLVSMTVRLSAAGDIEMESVGVDGSMEGRSL